jgi:hypothetical protein
MQEYTSKFATDVQKAYKDGYIKGQLDALKQLQEDCKGVYGEYIPEIINDAIRMLEDMSNEN